jgi:multidrug efflux pump subunit AcrB
MFLLVPWLGQDFFPDVDTGQIKLHMRAPTGMRIEETARLCDQVEGSIRQTIPPQDLGGILDNIGLPLSPINLIYSNSAPIGSADADILVSLKENHKPTKNYIAVLSDRLRQQFSHVTFAFLPADMVSQILNFGLPAPIDVQVAGSNSEATRRFVNSLLNQMQHVPGAADLRIQQAFDQLKTHGTKNNVAIVAQINPPITARGGASESIGSGESPGPPCQRAGVPFRRSFRGSCAR